MPHPQHLRYYLVGQSQPSFECPQCGVHSLHVALVPKLSHMGPMETLPPPSDNPKGVVFPVPGVSFISTFHHLLFQCVACHKITYFVVEQESKSVSLDNELQLKFPFPRIVHQYPVAKTKPHQAVPLAISQAINEAELSNGIGAFNACAVMLRRAVHNLCEDKGANGKDLFAQLADLKSKQIITPDLWTWAEELRVLGRNGAHPEWPDVSRGDAEYGLKFIGEIVRFVYVNPHEVSQRNVKGRPKNP